MGGNGCKASFKICVSLAKSSVRGDTLSAICRCRRSGIWWSWRKIAAACSPAWYCEEPRGRRAPPYLPPDSTTASTYKKRLYSQIAGADKGAVDEEIRVSCAAHIEEAKPIGATVTVVSVTEAELPGNGCRNLGGGIFHGRCHRSADYGDLRPAGPAGIRASRYDSIQPLPGLSAAVSRSSGLQHLHRKRRDYSRIGRCGSCPGYELRVVVHSADCPFSLDFLGKENTLADIDVSQVRKIVEQTSSPAVPHLRIDLERH